MTSLATKHSLQSDIRPFQPSFQGVPPNTQQFTMPLASSPLPPPLRLSENNPKHFGHTLGPVFSKAEDGDDEAFIAEKMMQLGVNGYPGQSARRATAAPRHQPSPAQQAHLQRQFQLQQQHLLLQAQAQQAASAQAQAQQFHLRQQSPSTSQDTLAKLQFQQAQLAAAAGNPQLQAHLLMQVQAQRALLVSQLSQQQAELSRQIQLQKLQQAQAQQAQQPFGGLDRTQVAALSHHHSSHTGYTSPSSAAATVDRHALAAQVQARTKIRQDDLRARFESIPNPTDTVKVAEPAAFAGPDKFGWVSPTSTSPIRSASSSPTSDKDPQPRLQFTVKLGRSSTRLRDHSVSSRSSISDSSDVLPAPLEVPAAGRQTLGVGRPSTQRATPGYRALSTPNQGSPRVEVTGHRSVTYTPGTGAGLNGVKPIRQPTGPPGAPNELGDKNFQARIRRKVGLNLGMLGRRTESPIATPVVA